MAATIGQNHKNGFKIVEIWDNHSVSLKNNLYNDLKGPEHLLGGMNLENEIDTCQTTVCCIGEVQFDNNDRSVVGIFIPYSRVPIRRHGMFIWHITFHERKFFVALNSNVSCTCNINLNHKTYSHVNLYAFLKLQVNKTRSTIRNKYWY